MHPDLKLPTQVGRIDARRLDSMGFWAEKFGISKAELLTIVKIVGTSPDAVADALATGICARS